jgi:hypothetical protein
MIITPNTILNPNNKNIRFYECSTVAIDSVNTIGKLNLADLQIPFDSEFTSKLTLNAGATSQPILYGFLGSDVTFLLIKATYGSDGYACPNVENYLEYYFEDDPSTVRTMGQIMILTGTLNHRIPQIYLNNPTTSKVTIDVMMANLEQSDLDSLLYEGGPTTIKNLYWNSINSNKVWYGSISGSTQLEIYNASSEIVMTIPYPEIDTIEVSGNNLIINTHSFDPITLEFLSEFNRRQAHSRIHWVLQSTQTRYLTPNAPGLDIYGPYIIFIPSGMTQVISTTGSTSYNEIRDYWVSGATDNRDGWLEKSNITLIIREQGTVAELSAITSDGDYEVLFVVYDLAGNQTIDVRYIIRDSSMPVIHLKTGLTTVSGWTYMNISADTAIQGYAYASDFRNYLIDYILDDVDGFLPISSAITYVYSGSTYIASGRTFDAPITGVGYYVVSFMAEDRVGNTGRTSANVALIETVPPVIWYTSNMTGGNLFTMDLNTGLTFLDIMYYTVTAVTDNYDHTLTINDINLVVLSGVTNSLSHQVYDPLVNSGVYTLLYTVTDGNGNTLNETKYLDVEP